MNKKGKVATIIATIAVAGIIYGVGYLNGDASAVNKINATLDANWEAKNATTDTMATETPTEDLTVKAWKEVIKFSGSSIKTTQKFTVTADEWRIKWDTTPTADDANFQIYVNNADGSIKSVVANIIGKGSDESYITGSGEFSLTINTSQKYNVTIEEQ